MTDQPGLVRSFRALQAHDCFERCAFGKAGCAPGAPGFHGIGSVRLFFAVAMPARGGVSFLLHTPIYPRTVTSRRPPTTPYEPLGVVDLHYVNPPDYLAELGPGSACNVVEGHCWSDCTFTGADAGFDAFTAGGEAGVWSWLAETYLPTVLRAQP